MWENPDQIERYSSAFDRLRAAAMNPHQSASFLEALAEEMI